MPTTTSADGTTIAYSRTGEGPPIVLVDGAFGHRSFGPNEALVPLLAPHFEVVTYDRRGRGGSGDTAPFALDREIEDLRAVLDVVGGSAYVYGISSGAALCLRALAMGLPITRLALFEPPISLDEARPAVPAGTMDAMRDLLARDDRGRAVKMFLRDCAEVPAPVLLFMPLLPPWRSMKAVAPTVLHDLELIDDPAALLPERWGATGTPVLVTGGTKSPEWMRSTVAAVAGRIPSAELTMLPGQMHIVKPGAIGPVLVEFFTRKDASLAE